MKFILTHYDYHGAPCYSSACGTYLAKHIRYGLVNPKTKKAENDYYKLLVRRKPKSPDWMILDTGRIKTRKELKYVASRHQALLNAQLELSKELNDSRNARSSKTSARRSKNTSARGTKRNKGKRKVSKASNHRDD